MKKIRFYVHSVTIGIKNFEGKSIVVTGASGGIGSEIAQLFAKSDANVVVHYFSSSEKAGRTVKSIQDLGSEAFSFQADVTDPHEVSSMIGETIHRFGDLDVLVNNAAQHPPTAFNFENPDTGNSGSRWRIRISWGARLLPFRCSLLKENEGDHCECGDGLGSWRTGLCPHQNSRHAAHTGPRQRTRACAGERCLSRSS